MVKGNEKGGEFERRMCRELSLWLSSNESPDHLWRSSMSGGRLNTPSRREITKEMRENQSGDVSGLSPLGLLFTRVFSFECKFHKEIHVDGLVYGTNQTIVGFWDQCREDAKQVDKLPFLLIKENRRPILVGVDRSGILLFPSYIKYVLISKHNLYLITFDYMRSVVTGDAMRQILRRMVKRDEIVDCGRSSSKGRSRERLSLEDL